MSLLRTALASALLLPSLLAGCVCPKEKLQSISGDGAGLSLNGSSVHIRPIAYQGDPVTILEWDSSAAGSMTFEIIAQGPDIHVSAADGSEELKLDAGPGNTVTLRHANSRVSFEAVSRTGNRTLQTNNRFTARANPELPHLTRAASIPNTKAVIIWADFDGVRTSFYLSEH